MFKEVSQSALVVILLDRADALRDVEIGDMFGILVVTNVVGESIIKLAYTCLWVGRQLWQLLSPRTCRCCYEQEKH